MGGDVPAFPPPPEATVVINKPFTEIGIVRPHEFGAGQNTISKNLILSVSRRIIVQGLDEVLQWLKKDRVKLT